MINSQDRYVALTVGLKRIYPEFSYTAVPIVLGATGLVMKSLIKNLSILGFKENDVKLLVQKMQTKALVGTMRIVKSAMTLKS